jgi:predicted transcriptional regulator
MMTEKKGADKEALKQLREQRRPFIDKAKQAIKEQNRLMKQIRDQLEKGGSTVPEIAKETMIPTRDVMWFVSTMRKYGMVAEGAKEGDYFKYELVKQR